MAYDLAPLRSYVRFYQSVVTQLTTAWSSLVQIHESARSALGPFAEPMAPLSSPTLTAALAQAPGTPAALTALWQPQDPKDLTGLTDVYEVVGRFTFQGVDNENLGRVQALVATARNEVHQQRTRLTELVRLPELARATADRLAADEAKNASKRKSDRLAAFAPLAQTLHQRAKQTMDALRAVPLPELTDVATAADEYRKFALKLDQVYQTCLPFLRKSLADMFTFAGCEVPNSWPDTLPVIPDLPAELLTVPPADSPQLMQARHTIEALHEEESQLIRARDDLTVTRARLEGDINSLAARDQESQHQIERAGLLVTYATALEQIRESRRAMANLEQQKSQRTMAVGEVWQRHKQTEAAIKALEEELSHRTQEIGQAGQRLAVERDNEPALFGKDDWRGRVASIEAEIEDLRNAFTQRQGMLNQLKIDLSALAVQVQTEQSQSALIDRWLEDAQKREKALQDQSRELESQLGAEARGRALTVAEAEQIVAQRQNERAELLERAERMRAEVRRNQEDNARILARLKQIETERQRMTAFEQSAAVAATQGREAALRQLAARRRAAVEQHVTDVLGGLEKSLLSVEAVFVEPAKEMMLRDDKPIESLADKVRAAAERVAPVVETLQQDLDPQLLAQDAMLGQVQREFCDVAPDACRNAWGS